jgi:hypothetical protein
MEKEVEKKESHFIMTVDVVNFECKFFSSKDIGNDIQVYSCNEEKNYKKFGEKEIRLISCRGCVHENS